MGRNRSACPSICILGNLESKLEVCMLMFEIVGIVLKAVCLQKLLGTQFSTFSQDMM